MGPIFRRNVCQATGAPRRRCSPMFPGGFAAVEAEYIYRMGEDAPAGKTDWTPAGGAGAGRGRAGRRGVRRQPAGQHQRPGSPRGGRRLRQQRRPDPRAAPFPTGTARTDDWPPCEAYVDGKLVGRGAPSSLPGGPAASLAFLMNAAAARGRPLKRGQLVTTGAASGIHDIEAGQTARITFARPGRDPLHRASRPSPAGGPGGSNR